MVEDARGTRAAYNVAVMAELKGPVEIHKPTHFTARETEAWRRALAQGPKKQVDFPFIPLKPTVCQDSSVMSHAMPAPRWGKEEGGQRPAESNVGEIGSVPKSTGGG